MYTGTSNGAVDTELHILVGTGSKSIKVIFSNSETSFQKRGKTFGE